MGKVAITYRIMPSGVNVDLDGMTKKLGALLAPGVEVKSTRIVPVAFGLKALEVLVVCNDEGGIEENVERSLSSLEGVESVTAVDTTLL